MQAHGDIIPVIVVGDVRDKLLFNVVPAWHYALSAPAVGNFSWCSLEWSVGSAIRPKKILVDRVHFSVSAGMHVGIGLRSAPPGGQDGLPRRKLSSQQSSALAARALRGNDPGPLATFLVNQAAYIATGSVSSFVVEFPEPLVLEREGDALVICGATANTGLNCTFDWREIF